MLSADEHVGREACIDTKCMSAHTRFACASNSGLWLLR